MPSAAEILIAEDLQPSVEVLKLAFARAGLKVSLHFVGDGEEAVLYLKGEAPYSNRRLHPLPRLLLLDLKMPRLDGFDVLQWLRAQPGLKRLLVVVLTASAEPSDIKRAYDLGANSYLVKPAGFEKLQDLVKSLETYWLQTNQPPDCAPFASRPPE